MSLKAILVQSKQSIDVNKYEHPTGTLIMTFLKAEGKKFCMSGFGMSHRQFLSHLRASISINECLSDQHDLKKNQKSTMV